MLEMPQGDALASVSDGGLGRIVEQPARPRQQPTADRTQVLHQRALGQL